jgi:hypothetical protein
MDTQTDTCVFHLEGNGERGGSFPTYISPFPYASPFYVAYMEAKE